MPTYVVDSIRDEETQSYLDLVSGTDWRGVDHEVHVETGAPGPTILDAARRHEADLVVMGAHGRTGFDRLFLGSVSEHVVKHTEGSVLVVRGDGG
jgi:nucleotide-binding universal stress UspA family protein